MTATRATEPRADARRNRARVLAAAEDLFARRGLAVPLDEIAQAAGVGAGTVYRHFPTKDALFEAVMAQRIEQLGTVAAEALDDADPGAAFFGFLGHAMRQARLNRALCEAMARHDEWRAAAATTGPHCRFRECFAALLARAQVAGAVRGDVDVDDVSALVPGYAAMAAHRQDDAGARRLLDLLRDGLRPTGTKRSPDRNETSDSFEFHNESRADDRNETTDAGTGGESETVGQAASRCQVCGGRVDAAATGRRPKYCGAACRQKAHRERNANRIRAEVALAGSADIDRPTARVGSAAERWPPASSPRGPVATSSPCGPDPPRSGAGR